MELKSYKIRNEILNVCNYFIKIVSEKEIIFDVNLDKLTVLNDLEDIKKSINEHIEFTVGFVGEFSSGKTTIINLLTGLDFATNTNVSTNEIVKINWNGITLIDTPGLGSGRQEHDEITEKWLSSADLLIYVLTIDLFIKYSGKRFIQMLDKFKRENEIMIVMNMIDQEENEIETYRDALQQVLEPRPIDDYYPTFISAKYKLNSLDNDYTDLEQKQFESMSNFNQLVSNLNQFVLDKKDRAILSTPLNRLHQLSRKFRFKSKFELEESLIEHKISICETGLRGIKSSFDDYKNILKEKGNATVGNIYSMLDEPKKTFEQDCKNEFDKFINNTSELDEQLITELSLIIEEFTNENEKMDASSLAKSVRESINKSSTLKIIFGFETNDSVKSNASWNELQSISVNKINEFDFDKFNLGEDKKDNIINAFNSKDLFEGIGHVTKLIDKKVVLDIGHLLKYKFKPWEATKILTKVTKIAPFLNILSALWDVYSIFRDKKRENDAAKEIREFKESVLKEIENISNDKIKVISDFVVKPFEDIINMTLQLNKEAYRRMISFSNENQILLNEFEEQKSHCLVLFNEIYE